MIKLTELMDSDNIAGVFVVVKNKLLVLYNHSGEMEIPKGHIKVNESPIEGAIRELEEETQIKLQIEPKPLGVKQIKEGKKFYMYVFKTNTHYDVIVSDEHSSYEYIELSELTKELRWTPTLNFLNNKLPGDLK